MIKDIELSFSVLSSTSESFPHLYSLSSEGNRCATKQEKIICKSINFFHDNPRLYFLPYDSKNQLNLLQAIISFLKSYDFSTPLIFCHQNIIFNSTIAPVFGTSFDVALPLSSEETFSLNNCRMIIINNKNPSNCIRFLTNMLESFTSYNFSLSSSVSLSNKKYNSASDDSKALRLDLFRIARASCCFILTLNPCDYNFSPKVYGFSVYNYSYPYVIDFSASAWLMEYYWYANICPLYNTSLKFQAKSFALRLIFWARLLPMLIKLTIRSFSISSPTIIK